LTPVRNTCPAVPSGDVIAAISVNLIGTPGHGFDGAVVPGGPDPPALFELPLQAVPVSATTAITHAIHLSPFMTVSP
jgi:hypothetical protein